LLSKNKTKATLIPKIWIESNITKHHSLKYINLSHSKVVIVRKLMEMCYNQKIVIIYSDVDSVILRPNFIDYIDFFITSYSAPRLDLIYLKEEGVGKFTLSSGFYIILPTDFLMSHIKNVENLQITDNYKYNENHYHNIAIFKNITKGIRWEVLDPLLFANSWVYFRKQLPQSLGVTPYYVHANFRSNSEKELMLKKFNIWFTIPT